MVEDLKKENQDLKAKVEDLTKSLSKTEGIIEDAFQRTAWLGGKNDDLEMYTRKYNLEIHRVPEKEGEDLEEMVIKAAESVQIDIDEDDIDIVHRMPSKKTGMRPIIVRFKSYKAKSKVYFVRKKSRRVSSYDDTLNGAKALYFNENLTSYRRKLYAEVRKRGKKLNSWFSTWTIDGKIFVRTEKGEKPQQISNQSDLEYLYQNK